MPDKQLLLEKALQCRRLAAAQTDQRLREELLKQAVEFEERAREADAK